MSWVRYDDGFHDHAKVAHVRAECPEALALHILANTWTSSRTDRPGFVPATIPTVLVGKAKGRKWAAVLVAAGLWDEVEGGWEFHNYGTYRAPTARQTPGTPELLSEKRALAGRRGGQQTASKRQANGAANAATQSSNGKQLSSKRCSPVVASNEATPGPVPVPPTVGATSAPAPSGQRVNEIAKTYTDRVKLSNFMAVRGVVAKAVSAGYDEPRVVAALAQLADEGRGVSADTLRIALEGRPRRSVSDGHVSLPPEEYEKPGVFGTPTVYRHGDGAA